MKKIKFEISPSKMWRNSYNKRILYYINNNDISERINSKELWTQIKLLHTCYIHFLYI